MLTAAPLGSPSSAAHKQHRRDTPGPSSDPLRHLLPHDQHQHDPYGTHHHIRKTIRPVLRDDGEWTEEALAWYGRTVVWSRGAEVYRRYTYEHEGESVGYACFAWLRTGGGSSETSKKRKLASTTSSTPDTFGPFHRSQHSSWGGPRSSTHKNAPLRLERTLVVFLQTRAHVYYADGSDIIVHLPFTVDGAWGLPNGGILVQRELEKRELRKFGREKKKVGSVLRGMADQTSMSILDDLMDIEDESAPSLPRLYALENPFDELKVVMQGQIEFGDALHLSSTHPISATCSVLMVSEDPYPFVVVYDQHAGEFIIYRRTCVPIISLQPAPPPNPRTMRPEELLRQAELTQIPPQPRASRPSLHRNASSFGATTGDRRLSSVADSLDRGQRRVPRLSRGPLPESASTDELHAVLEPDANLPPPTAPQHRRSRGMSMLPHSQAVPPGPEGQRRLSTGLPAQPLPIPPRMALQTAVEKDLRETTMMMGLERDEVEVRSEVVLSVIGRWKQPYPVDPQQLNAFISEDKGPNQVTVNIHVLPLTPRPSTSPQLFSFHITLPPLSNRVKIDVATPLKCLSAVPVLATRIPTFSRAAREGVHDVLFLTLEGRTQLMTSGRKILPFHVPVEDGTTISSLTDASGPHFTAVYEDGSAKQYSAAMRIRHELTEQCFLALSGSLSAEEFYQYKIEFLSSLQQLKPWETNDEERVWGVFVRVLEGILGVDHDQVEQHGFGGVMQAGLGSADPISRRLASLLEISTGPLSKPSSTHAPRHTLPPQRAVSLLLAIHLVGQDQRLALSKQRDLERVAGLIIRLAIHVGRKDWVDYWERLVPMRVHNVTFGTGQGLDYQLLDQFSHPPDIIVSLYQQLRLPVKEFIRPETLYLYRHGAGSDLSHTDELGPLDTCPRITLVTRIYKELGPSTPASARPLQERAYQTVRTIAETITNPDWISDLPHGVSLPILEVLRACQVSPEKDWTAGMYKLVGRSDLVKKVEEGGLGGTVAKDDWPKELELTQRPTVGEIMKAAETEPLGNKKTDLALPHVRFRTDRRLQEVERIMQTAKLRIVTIQDPKGASAEDVTRYHQSFVNTLASRTLAVTVGQGMFEYGTRTTVITDVWEIPFIELSVKVTPGNTLLKAEIVSDSAEWPCFHNGVSAGLSISPDCKDIDSSWIVFNRPGVLNAEHGGFLLGLGLTGHLRSLMTYHAFPLMEPRHDFTSVGLLLGLACSYAGSNDLLVTKILSLHTHALLPLGSVELNASPIIQSSAMVGIGLVYVGSRNLRMAEVALYEIGRRDMPNVDGFGEYQESYSFSASMAYGLIMLGRGGSTASEVDRKMLAQLRKCIVGEAPVMDGSHAKTASPGVDINTTAPGATLALGLAYLKTMRRDIADLLEIPQTPYELEHVKPEWCLLRILARALIMWDDIAPTTAWVESLVPSFVLAAVKSNQRPSSIDLSIELAYLNIVSGAAMAIGLKYAGTAKELAHNTILTQYSILAKAVSGQSMTYEGRIRRTSARQGLNVVTIALAAVMSGTGELGLLRRLRVSHGQEGAGVTYGTHMAMHMALGLLFVGRGEYTLGNSCLAIAAMCIAFFPRFTASPADNKAYPQAFRHLWALAVEARCVTARDVETHETVYLPVKLRFMEGGTIRQQSLISPTQLPSFDRLLTIEVDSPRYWPIKIDLSDPRDMEALVRTRSIYVQRKAGFIDYESDPKGNRSIFVRVGSMTGIDLHYDLISSGAPPSVGVGEVKEIVRVHSGDAGLIGLAEHFEGVDDEWGGGVGAFLRTIIIECLALDKPHLIPIYIQMYLSLRRDAAHITNPALYESGGMHTVDQLTFAKRFYDEEYEVNFAQMKVSGERRIALVRQSFLNAARRTLLESPGEEDVAARYLLQGVEGWREDPQRLGRWLARNGVPPLPLLEALRLGVAKLAVGKPELEMKMRDSADIYWGEVLKTYSEQSDGQGRRGEGWKLHSVQQTIDLWRGV
ncbi:hypothetical protein B9479_006286 [Cryptococcus floricola]|uniref:Uncharacterized protein n=1 Tax=Cryptococcus floricola TaxID=2591691 RepID=A0A5D3ANU6_9TREE|nr:hypothetical protein B9479_006286 [Cryptococcus floricola]